MGKKIAVVITTRQDEALRMSIGLTLVDDAVDVFFLDSKLVKNKRNALNLQTSQELDIALYSNCEEGQEVKWLPTEQLAEKLLSYDHILPY